MDNYSLNEPGWALLEEARQLGRTVSLLSNLAPYNQLAIDRKWPHFFGATHHNFYSYELGLHKPDPEIFRAACAALRAEPAECVFLDDLAENVEGAREAGLKGLRFANDRIPEIRETIGLSPGVSATTDS
jgi:HAD superfamily hydrolase (TIGR01509 family)